MVPRYRNRTVAGVLCVLPRYFARTAVLLKPSHLCLPRKKRTLAGRQEGRFASSTRRQRGGLPIPVIVKTPHGQLTSKIAFGLNGQVLWNTDSSGFAVTGSSGGANGQYQSSAFSLQNGRLVQIPLTRLIEKAFGQPMKCGWPETPNVAAVKWLDQKRLLLAAEIINHSNCDCFGTFKGYVVDVINRSVVRVYDQLEAKRQFHADVGPWLRDANDEWARNPKSCYMPSNHPELHDSR